MGTDLDGLLEWVNFDSDADDRRLDEDRNAQPRMRAPEVRHRLRAFVARFSDADPWRSVYGWRVAEVRKRAPHEWRDLFKVKSPAFRHPTEKDEIAEYRIEQLRYVLNRVLEGTLRVALPSLSFSVDFDPDRLNTLAVSGDLQDVVLYCAARYVVDADVTFGRCAAPAASTPGHRNDWREVCGNLFVAGGRGDGRGYCSGACKRRAKAQRKAQRRRRRGR
jgi:hypothetical protein